MANKVKVIPVKIEEKTAGTDHGEQVEEAKPVEEVVVVNEEEIEDPGKVEVVREVEAAEQPATVEERYKPRELYSLKLKDLSPDLKQPRKHFDDADLRELVSSIKSHGVLQPILFRKAEDGKLIIVAGERRFRATKLAGKHSIPAMFVDGANHAEIALIENLLRVDLTAIEEAEALDRLKTEAKYTNAKLAQVMGKGESTISETLKLVQLPEKLRKKHGGNKNLSKRALLEVTKAATPELMEKLFKKALKKELKRDEVRADRNDDKDSKASRGPDIVCRTMSGGLLKALDKLDLEELDEIKRTEVEDTLTGTLKRLAEILGYRVDKR